ncbi:hypothetical protein CCACVL1_18321 [Corchorus capsularis]|uniref:Uncharacterized protein n=1 Tax=Corchorus capsularis TaxID=210143 RepID=A0A1R3HLW7_COCAP|nr:hypothetical protein CCACVL1_18321 [Corchorus capsularis]
MAKKLSKTTNSQDDDEVINCSFGSDS